MAPAANSSTVANPLKLPEVPKTLTAVGIVIGAVAMGIAVSRVSNWIYNRWINGQENGIPRLRRLIPLIRFVAKVHHISQSPVDNAKRPGIDAPSSPSATEGKPLGGGGDGKADAGSAIWSTNVPLTMSSFVHLASAPSPSSANQANEDYDPKSPATSSNNQTTAGTTQREHSALFDRFAPRHCAAPPLKFTKSIYSSVDQEDCPPLSRHSSAKDNPSFTIDSDEDDTPAAPCLAPLLTQQSAGQTEENTGEFVFPEQLRQDSARSVGGRDKGSSTSPPIDDQSTNGTPTVTPRSRKARRPIQTASSSRDRRSGGGAVANVSLGARPNTAKRSSAVAVPSLPEMPAGEYRFAVESES